MTKQQLAAHTAPAVSPSLSLRQAVRPLIFAHALLGREQGLSAELAEECGKLKQLTRQALEAAALVHLLAPDKAERTDAQSSRRSQFIDAYAKAGMTWAEVTGTAIALADALLDADRPDDARRLAAFLEAADEPAIAQDLRARAEATVKRSLEIRLGRIHARMTEPEIADAIGALRESRDKTAASFYMHKLAQSIRQLLDVSREEQYVHDFGSYPTKITWCVTPGSTVSRSGYICAYGNASRPSYVRIPFAALVSKLLVSAGSEAAGSMAVASVIPLPEPLLAELQVEQPSIDNIFARLDTLARIFRQIQTEKARPRALSE